MKKILWIAPNFNHYKANFLNRLAEYGEFSLTVLAGSPILKQGHRPHKGEEHFSKDTVPATKDNFYIHPSVYLRLLGIASKRRYDVILMPAEKKHLPVILFLFLLKFPFHFKLITYNHPKTGCKKGIQGFLDDLMSRFLFSLYDRIIFYTREGMEGMIWQKLIPKEKASFANNTLDTEGIWRQYTFEVNTSEPKVIIFIGRLIANKRLKLLLEYHREIKKTLSGVRLNIIGDGPESETIKQAIEKDNSISWQGAIIDEAQIVRHMRAAHLVLVPGCSGLSIVHAFCYGKPYATISSPHPPETVYLKDSENGLILSGDIHDDCRRISTFLNDPIAYQKACMAAFDKAKELSIGNWCRQMINAIDEL